MVLIQSANNFLAVTSFRAATGRCGLLANKAKFLFFLQLWPRCQAKFLTCEISDFTRSTQLRMLRVIFYIPNLLMKLFLGLGIRVW